MAKHQGIRGSQRIKQSCGVEVSELGGSWVLRLRPGIVQKLELQGSMKIGVVISSSQGTPELVGVRKVNPNSEVRDCLWGRWSQKSG